MTVVSNTTIGGGLMSYDKRLNRRYGTQDIFAVTKKRQLYRRNELKDLPAFSFLGQCADLWTALSQAQKDDWHTAGVYCELTGYNLFIQDQTYRIINEIAGSAIPSIYHQYKIGHLLIPEGAGHFLLRQVGNNEFIGNGKLKISYKSALITDNGGGEYVKVRFKYQYDLGGGELTETDEITLNLNQGWVNVETDVINNDYQTGHWELEIEGDKIKGDLWFDNLYMIAVNGICTKDPGQVKPELLFNNLIIPEGMTTEIIYPDDSI